MHDLSFRLTNLSLEPSHTLVPVFGMTCKASNPCWPTLAGKVHRLQTWKCEKHIGQDSPPVSTRLQALFLRPLLDTTYVSCIHRIATYCYLEFTSPQC